MDAEALFLVQSRAVLEHMRLVAGMPAPPLHGHGDAHRSVRARATTTRTCVLPFDTTDGPEASSALDISQSLRLYMGASLDCSADAIAAQALEDGQGNVATTSTCLSASALQFTPYGVVRQRPQASMAESGLERAVLAPVSASLYVQDSAAVAVQLSDERRHGPTSDERRHGPAEDDDAATRPTRDVDTHHALHQSLVHPYIQCLAWVRARVAAQ